MRLVNEHNVQANLLTVICGCQKSIGGCNTYPPAEAGTRALSKEN
jgi:hypothetical protein